MFGVETSDNITNYLFKAFGVTLVDIIPLGFEGQWFSVSIENEVSNAINDGILRNLTIAYLPQDGTSENSIGTIYLPEQSLRECVSDTVPRVRLIYFVFLTDSFFYSISSKLRATPPIVAARTNCSVTKLSYPILSTFLNTYVQVSLIHSSFE